MTETTNEIKVDISSSGQMSVETKAQGLQGYSAYEIAVQQGYVGTEEEWLSSLKGVDGKDGVNGTDGTNGVDGYSPKATVSKVGTTSTITITDKDGTTTTTINDGKDGDSYTITQADYQAIADIVLKDIDASEVAY